MSQPPKPLTVAEIHSVYATTPSKKSPPGESRIAQGENPASKYIKSSHFKRDPNHGGKAPDKADLMRGPRRK